MGVFQEQNRGEIRRSIGYNLNDVIVSEVTTTTTDKSILKDSYGLAKGGDDEYNGRQVMIYDSAGGTIVDGEKSFVSDFAIATFAATCLPIFTANITDGDKYEMWRVFTVEEINDAINQAVLDAASSGVLVDRQTDGNFVLSGEYEYDWLVPYAFGNDFKGLHKVEYAADTGTFHDIHTCEVAWDEALSNTTVAVDTTYNVEGSYCVALTVADAAAADAILACDSITSLDISDCDEVEITIRSSVALAAGDLHLVLDNTAACVSGTEILDIPATLANTTTTHVIDLVNPQSDTAIISVGIEMEVDKGAFTLYVDRIRAVKSSTKRYEKLNPEHWFIVKGTTPKFALTDGGLSLVGAMTEMRLTGYSAPDIFSDETTDSEIDPAWVIARTTGRLLIGHAKSSRLDIDDRANLAKYWLGEAERRLPYIRTKFQPNTRWVS